MTETIDGMSDTTDTRDGGINQQQLARDIVEQARAQGIELVGPGGLLTGLTKTVLETALEAEMSEHLGYDKHAPEGPQPNELAQRQPGQDRADRARPGRGRRAAG